MKRNKNQHRLAQNAKNQRLETEKASYRQTLLGLFDQVAHPLNSQEDTPLSDDRSSPGALVLSQEESPGLLGTALSAAVPLRLLEMYARGSVEPWEFGSAQAFGRVLASDGDKLLYRSKKAGETAQLFNGLSRALALLAFVPGGVSVFGQRFDARAFLSAWAGAEAAKPFCQASLQRFYDEIITVVPASCSLAQSNTALGTWNVIRWFETASDEQLTKIRMQGYRNCSVDGQIQPESIVTLILQEIFKQADWEVTRFAKKERGTPEALQRLAHARLLLKARDERQPLICSIESIAAEKWLFLFRHDLVTGRF